MADYKEYYFGTLTCGDDWTQENIAQDIHRSLSAIAITNDDTTYDILVVLNDLSCDEILVKAGESVAINVDVYRLWYKTATAGQTPVLRVVAD